MTREYGRYFEEKWDTKGFYPEILYKGTFRTHLPWRERNDYDALVLFIGSKFNLDLTNIKIELKQLCHITHDKEAEAIESERDSHYRYIFKPKSKKGKCYDKQDGSPIGESYVICNPDEPSHLGTQYRRITSDKTVLPGLYIWWSIDDVQLNFTHDSISLLMSKIFPADLQLSRPFQKPEVSLYGNIKFSCGLTQLLKCYLNAYKRKFGSHLDAHIEFRCGGTLRYRYEICYVIIVCAIFPDTPSLPCDEYPVIFEDLSKSIKYDEDGEVNFVKPYVLSFKNVISKYDTKQYSWDTYAFALHFPDDSYVLECPCALNFEKSRVDHYKCIRSVDKICPNVIAQLTSL